MHDEKLYLEIINNLKDGVYFVDNERRITFWNKAAEELTGFKRDDIIGKCCQSNLLNHIDAHGSPLCTVGCPLHASIIDGEQRTGEVFLRHKSGHRIPIIVNIFPIIEDGEITGAIEIFTPNSPVVYDDHLIETLTNLALTDQLTGVPNRIKLENFLEYRFNEMRRYKSMFCVVFLDIDNFGKLNNTYGHELGDEVLKSITKSVMHSIRITDMFGRWGGEEFIGVFEIKKEEEAVLLAEKLRVLIAGSEIPYEGESVSVTASFGVTVANYDDSIESVVKRADLLMYQSKNNGKNCVTSDILKPSE